VNRYIANGSTLNFAYTFAIQDTSSILVLMDTDIQVHGSHFSLTGVASTTGGLVVFNFFPPDGARITILRNQALSQLTNYLANSSYSPLTVMRDLDKGTMVDQMHTEQLSRTVKLGQQSTYSGLSLPDPVSGSFLRWKTDLSGLENTTLAAVGTGTVLTNGSVPFGIGSAGVMGQDAAQFFWDNSTKQLLIGGPSSPTGILDVYHNYATGIAPSSQTAIRAIVECKGDNATFIGCAGMYIQARDRSDVNAGNKGVLFGLLISAVPRVSRNNVPFDDVAGIGVVNDGVPNSKGTEAIYVGHNAAYGNQPEWIDSFGSDANVDYGFRHGGIIEHGGIHLWGATILSGHAMQIPNNTYLVARNVGNTGFVRMVGLTSGDIVDVGNTSDIRISGRAFPDIDNVRDLGTTSFLWRTLYLKTSLIMGADLFILDSTGTITKTNNVATVSATKTVRASGGAGDCTMIFQGGLLTGGSC